MAFIYLPGTTMAGPPWAPRIALPAVPRSGTAGYGLTGPRHPWPPTPFHRCTASYFAILTRSSLPPPPGAHHISVSVPSRLSFVFPQSNWAPVPGAYFVFTCIPSFSPDLISRFLVLFRSAVPPPSGGLAVSCWKSLPSLHVPCILVCSVRPFCFRIAKFPVGYRMDSIFFVDHLITD